MSLQKKIAIINDLSGFGRCSLTVSIPIISAMGIQTCPIPTAVLSCHTEYPDYYFRDFTDSMPAYIQSWEKLGLQFDGIATGFLGSLQQIDMVIDFIHRFRTTPILVDPVMGDHGTIYETYTPAMCAGMSRLVKHATIITPNLTEACVLTDTPYRETGLRLSDYELLAKKLCQMGPNQVIITGLPMGTYVGNYVYEANGVNCMVRKKHIEPSRPGTGDVFSSIIAANAVNKVPLKQSVTQAASFIQHCLSYSEELKLPRMDGVCFEECLADLIPKRNNRLLKSQRI